jgi:hypothetical protein
MYFLWNRKMSFGNLGDKSLDIIFRWFSKEKSVEVAW